MWKRRRIWLVLTAFAALSLGVLVELETHIGRGWLHGEEFFDGRPTSFWRARCDEWLDRFDDPDSLTQCTWLLTFEIPAEPGMRRFGVPEDLELKGASMAMPRETYWKRFMDGLRPKAELERERAYDYAPKILWATPETEPILHILEREEKYRWLATLALRRVKNYREVARVTKEALEQRP